MKWYREVANEIPLNIFLNALSLYIKVNNTNIGITEFREKIIQETLDQSAQIESDEEENNLNYSVWKKSIF